MCIRFIQKNHINVCGKRQRINTKPLKKTTSFDHQIALPIAPPSLESSIKIFTLSYFRTDIRVVFFTEWSHDQLNSKDRTQGSLEPFPWIIPPELPQVSIPYFRASIPEPHALSFVSIVHIKENIPQNRSRQTFANSTPPNRQRDSLFFINHSRKGRKIGNSRNSISGPDARTEHFDEKAVIDQREPEMQIPVLSPFSANLESISVFLLLLLGLEVRPQMTQRRHSNRRELFVPKPKALPISTPEKHFRSSLHLQNHPAKFPDRQALKERGFSRVISPRHKRDTFGVKIEGLLPVLLEAVKVDLGDHFLPWHPWPARALLGPHGARTLAGPGGTVQRAAHAWPQP